MNRTSSYRQPAVSKTITRPVITKHKKSVVADTEDEIVEDGITTTTARRTKIQPIAAPPIPDASAAKKKKATTAQAKLAALDSDALKARIEENREIVLKSAEEHPAYISAFENEDIEDNNAILIRDCAILLRTINAVRKKCSKICFCWLEDGLYIVIYDNIEYEKNVFYYPKETIPKYRFNGVPRYYYISPRDLSNATETLAPDSFLIINERLSEADETAYTSYKGSGKEILEFITYSNTGLSGSSHEFDITFDRTTSGVLPEQYWEEDVFTEFEYIRLTKPGFAKWDITASTVSTGDIVVKKILKAEQNDCNVIYNNKAHNFKLEISNSPGKIDFVLQNELDGISLDDPVNFTLSYPANNVLKGIKNNISQKMYLTIATPGYMKIEVVNPESLIAVILNTKEPEIKEVQVESTTIKEKKIQTKAAATPAPEGATEVEGTPKVTTRTTTKRTTKAAVTEVVPAATEPVIETVIIPRRGTRVPTKRVQKVQEESIY